MQSDILNNLNLIAENLFKSVEGQVYELLDRIIIIRVEILNQEPLNNIFNNNNIIIVANSLIIFQTLYYMFQLLLSLYNGNKTENVYIFIIKIICVTVLANNSYYICEQIISLIEYLTDAISEITNQVSGRDVNFINLKETIISIDDFMKDDLLTVNGLIKGIISFGAVSVLINFSIRYVKIIFLIIISPLALICFSSHITNELGNTWIKMFVSSLLLQIVVKIILFIPLSYKDINSLMYKIILVGSIQLIYNINNINSQLFNKFSKSEMKSNLYKG